MFIAWNISTPNDHLDFFYTTLYTCSFHYNAMKLVVFEGLLCHSPPDPNVILLTSTQYTLYISDFPQLAFGLNSESGWGCVHVFMGTSRWCVGLALLLINGHSWAQRSRPWDCGPEIWDGVSPEACVTPEKIPSQNWLQNRLLVNHNLNLVVLLLSGGCFPLLQVLPA